jgi:very-short-patch-repair endonuclease
MKAFFWVVIIVIVFAVLAKKFKGVKISGPQLPYQTKNRVMNNSEQALYINLQKTLGDSFIVLSKIRIEDFVEVKQAGLDKNERWGKRNKIKSRHVDFLICDINTTKPLLAIELDGASHRNYGRVERDNFVNNLYKDIGLKVEHISVGSNFAESALRIRDILKEG